jgi:putative membrane protein
MMKRLGTAIFAGTVGLASSVAWAQQNPPTGGNVGPNFAYGPMWHHGGGWHPAMFLAPFVLLLALVGAVALIVWLVRWANGGYHHNWQQPGPGRTALDILEERFARGEIETGEFEEKRKLLRR